MDVLDTEIESLLSTIRHLKIKETSIFYNIYKIVFILEKWKKKLNKLIKKQNNPLKEQQIKEYIKISKNQKKYIKILLTL